MRSDESDISETFEGKVELSVLVAEQSQLLQDLVQGRKLENKPRNCTMNSQRYLLFVSLCIVSLILKDILCTSMHIYAHLCTSMHIHQLKMSKALCSSFLYLSGGFSLNSRPAPPTQQMLDKFISVSNLWNTFSVGLEEAVRQTTIAEARCICKKMDRNGNIMNLKNNRYLKLMAFDVFTIVLRNENSSCFDIV